MTLRPYLDIIDSWLTHGSLNDPHKEFIMSKYEFIPLVKVIQAAVVALLSAALRAVTVTLLLH